MLKSNVQDCSINPIGQGQKAPAMTAIIATTCTTLQLRQQRHFKVSVAGDAVVGQKIEGNIPIVELIQFLDIKQKDGGLGDETMNSLKIYCSFICLQQKSAILGKPKRIQPAAEVSLTRIHCLEQLPSTWRLWKSHG